MADAKTATEIAVQDWQRDSAIHFAMRRLLNRLEDWVRVYPQKEADDMPEHDVRFVTGVGGEGPESVIRYALEATPALWLSVLPDDLVIVPKPMLRRFGMSENSIDMLASYGAIDIENRGRRMLYEEQDEEYRKRWRDG